MKPVAQAIVQVVPLGNGETVFATKTVAQVPSERLAAVGLAAHEGAV